MRRSARIDRSIFVSFSLLGVAAWWGCAKASGDPTTQASSTTTGSSSSGGGSGGGTADGGDAGVCVPSTPTPTQHVPVDALFVVDDTSNMQGMNWTYVTTTLPAFFKDPLSAGMSAGLLFFPYSAWDCDLDHYKIPIVPVGVLPANAAALTSAFPADALGVGRPTYPALEGALMQATALQDARPSHKVIVVFIAGGDPNGCDGNIDHIANLAGSALDYNGVRTHVIGMPGAYVALLNKIASQGGTMLAHNVTIDVAQLAGSLADIRTAAQGCDFLIPEPPDNKPLDPSEVNVSYTPKGMGKPVVLLRADDPAGCDAQPGWYYDSNTAPTKIVLCPVSCATVQADKSAAVDVLFDCKSQHN